MILDKDIKMLTKDREHLIILIDATKDAETLAVLEDHLEALSATIKTVRLKMLETKSLSEGVEFKDGVEE